jgi:hypothetical protein
MSALPEDDHATDRKVSIGASLGGIVCGWLLGVDLARAHVEPTR